MLFSYRVYIHDSYTFCNQMNENIPLVSGFTGMSILFRDHVSLNTPRGICISQW